MDRAGYPSCGCFDDGQGIIRAYRNEACKYKNFGREEKLDIYARMQELSIAIYGFQAD